MVRPLTKCMKDGRRYERRPDIDNKIEVALGQPLPILIERAAIGDSNAANYLPSECIVHLMRDARRSNDERKMNTLISFLLIRCERIVRAKLRRDSFQNPDAVADEVLEQFGELIAIDGTDQDKTFRLDFYECAFKTACLALCTNAINQELKRTANTISLTPDSDGEDSAAHESLMSQIAQLTQPTATIDEQDREKLRRAIETLPKDERDAVVLVYFLGYEVESEDKTKKTAATICGVTGRTIFNRLARAAKTLAQLWRSYDNQ